MNNTGDKEFQPRYIRSGSGDKGLRRGHKRRWDVQRHRTARAERLQLALIGESSRGMWRGGN